MWITNQHFILSLFFYTHILHDSQARFLYVNVTNGTLLGSWNDGVAKFSGIPYATPPLNDLRFEPPKPALAWNGTLNVSRDRYVACQQKAFVGHHNAITVFFRLIP